MRSRRLNDIMYAVGCKVPKDEAGLKNEVESMFYDRLVKEAEAHEKKYGRWPVFEPLEIESDDPDSISTARKKPKKTVRF